MNRIGLIGAGKWGKNYIKTLHKNKDVEIGWIYNKNREIEQGNLPKGCNFTKRYQDILKDPSISSVIIATPPGTHYSITKESLMEGKNALVEKPFTENSEQSLELIEIANKNNKVLMVGHIFLYNPLIKSIKEKINKNKIGKIKKIHSERINSEKIQNGFDAVWNLAPHDISIINYFTGLLPNEVFARRLKDNPLEELIEIYMGYPSNIDAKIIVGYSPNKKIRKTIVEGEKGNLIFEEKGNNKQFYKKSPLEIQCEDFFNCINLNKKPLSDGLEGYKNVKILESISDSIKKFNKVSDIF